MNENEQENGIEVRSFSAPIHIESPTDGKRGKLTGYPIVFGARSVTLKDKRRGEFTETITRSAVEGAIRNNPDMLYIYNHNVDEPLARVSNGSLKLEIDDKGLRATAELLDIPEHRKVIAMAEAGLIKGQSFRMKVNDDAWTYQDGKAYREVRSCDIVEMGPCLMPAYPDTILSAEARTALQSLHAEGAPEAETNDMVDKSTLALAEAEIALAAAEGEL